MPSKWNPFLYIKTAFNTIEHVKFVPGAKNPDKPQFVDRFLFWRQNALRVGCSASLIWLVLSLNDFQMAWRNVRVKLDAFPEMVRPYFERFIYAELLANTLSEMSGDWASNLRRCQHTADCWTDVGSFTRDAGKDTEEWLVASAIAPGVDGANGTYVEESMLRENRDCSLSKMVEHRTCARSSVVCCSVPFYFIEGGQLRWWRCLSSCAPGKNKTTSKGVLISPDWGGSSTLWAPSCPIC
ncbi:unnamed protein product [Effrenium voratum]|nr:unnamed protein product [Effrenium voratum]